ncbi:MAG: SUMF1/EgtB/PvdO family nonheme iron enzyme [Planctomycetes bacterium]|nr:SUMF1/EgtB/PvdO family nonheme iron enzyme [Planctomycetota bacterium]
MQKKRYREIWGCVLTGSNRVIRGGSWNNNARNCRSSNRNNNDPSNDNNNLGFRLVLPQPNRVIRRSAERKTT